MFALKKNNKLQILADLLLMLIHKRMQHDLLGIVLNDLEEILRQKRFEDLGGVKCVIDRSTLRELVKTLDPNKNLHLSSLRSCLSITLTIALIAEYCGHSSFVNIGVERDSGKTHSHAWLSFSDGEIIDTGGQSLMFTPLCRFSLLEWKNAMVCRV